MATGVIWQFALAGVVVVACGALFVLGFLRPRASRGHELRVDEKLQRAQRAATRAPGRLGSWLAKPLQNSRRATQKSASAGRKARRKASS